MRFHIVKYAAMYRLKSFFASLFFAASSRLVLRKSDFLRKAIRILSFLALVIAIGSCGPTLKPFTKSLYEDRNWSDGDLKRIQFYVSDNIVMRRQVSGGSMEVISGEIKIVDGRKVVEVIIPKGTPGVLLFRPKLDRFAISFEKEDDQKYLIFGPSPKASGRFVLLASEWGRRAGKVTYNGKKYSVDASSAYSALMVDLKKIWKTSVSSRTAKGRKIDR